MPIPFPIVILVPGVQVLTMVKCRSTGIFFAVPDDPRYESRSIVLADTIRSFGKNITLGTPWEEGDSWAAAYGPGNKIDSSYRTGNFEKRKYTYNAAGKLANTATFYSDDGLSFQARYEEKLSYDGTGARLLSDTTRQYYLGSWILASAGRSKYNSSGQLDSVWHYYTVMGVPYANGKSYKYYPDGKLWQVRYHRNEMTSWDVELETYDYTPGVDYPTYKEVWHSWLDNTLKSKDRYRYYAGSNPGPDSVIIDVQEPPFTTWKTIAVSRVFYDQENPKMILTFRPANDFLPAHTDTTRFYYETYDAGTSIVSPEKVALYAYSPIPPAANSVCIGKIPRGRPH